MGATPPRSATSPPRTATSPSRTATEPSRTATSPLANGGNCTIRGATRRRHAEARLLMVQNPHHYPNRVRLRHPRAQGPGRGTLSPDHAEATQARDAVFAGTRHTPPPKTSTFPHQQAEKSPPQQHVVSYNPRRRRAGVAACIGRLPAWGGIAFWCAACRCPWPPGRCAPSIRKTGEPKTAGYLCVMGDLNPQPAD